MSIRLLLVADWSVKEIFPPGLILSVALASFFFSLTYDSAISIVSDLFLLSLDKLELIKVFSVICLSFFSLSGVIKVDIAFYRYLIDLMS